jgi:hypothetical protein
MSAQKLADGAEILRDSESTAFILTAGQGWVLSFEDSYQVHLLEPSLHSCRPSFHDLPEASLEPLRASQDVSEPR